MAAAQVLLNTQTNRPSPQNGSLQGSRKRKPSMPSPASQENSMHMPSSSRHHINNSDNFRAMIRAIATYDNYPEEFVSKCAQYITSRGEAVSHESLMSECEERWPSETSVAGSYLDSTNSSSRPNSSLAAGSSSFHRTSALSLPSSSRSSGYTSLPSSARSSESSSQQHHSLTNYSNSTYGSVSYSGQYSGNASSYAPNTSSFLSAQSSSPNDIEEDSVDGAQNLPSVSGIFNESLKHSSSDGSKHQEELNGVSSLLMAQHTSSYRSSGLFGSGNSDMPFAASLATSIPVAGKQGNSVSNSESPGVSKLGENIPRDSDRLTAASVLPVSRSSTDLKNIDWNATGTEILAETDNCESLEFHKEAFHESENKSKSKARSAQHVDVCLKLVRQENVLLEKSRLCTSCSVKPRDVTFLPCGHFATCRSCAEPIFVCPLCNKNILATVNTFLS